MKEACNLGEGRACLTLAGAYKDGQGVKKDKSMVRHFNKKALDLYVYNCDKGNIDSCAMASNMYTTGYGTTQNYFKSNEFSKKACDGGKMNSCTKLGMNYYLGTGKRQDYKTANKYFAKACKGRDPRGCVQLGDNYMLGNGVKKDKKKAKEFFGKACDDGYQRGCASYSRLNR